MPTRRRDLLIAAGAVGLVISAPLIWKRLDHGFEFEPIPSLPGFRRLPLGVASGVGSVLAGIDTASDLQNKLRKEVAENPCETVFGLTSWPHERVPVAVFTDYNCPYCPTLSAIVIGLMENNAPIDVVWHDLPVLGSRSDAAAKAALAAAAQGQYLAVHQKLMRTVLRPGETALKQLAGDFGLDETQFLRDANSVGTMFQIEQARAIAAVFGIVGTPATIVGRTLVIGKIDERSLKQLIELESTESFRGCGAF